MRKIDLSDILCRHLDLVGINYIREMPVHKPVKKKYAKPWRVDVVLPDYLIAIECEGGQWSGGRHNRPSGFQKDMLKYNEVAILGYSLLRFNGDMIKKGEALATIERMIKVKKSRIVS
jgi:very-short-patch-repair endonuclease